MAGIHVATEAGLFVLGTERRSELENREINALARENGGWWAIVDSREVWRARSGEVWSQVAESGDRRLNCLLPLGDSLLLGTSEAHLVRLTNGEQRVVEGFEKADGRATWHTPWGGPPDVRSLSASDSGPLYANVHVGGILRSDDRGETWAPTIDINADVHEVRAGENGLVAAAAARGLALSDDGGRTWQYDRAGLHATYARAVGLCDDAILMTVSRGPNGGQAAVYRRARSGEGGFQKCEGGLPEWLPGNIDSGCLATAGNRAAIGTEEGRVFSSDDAGRTWQELASGLPTVRYLHFS